MGDWFSSEWWQSPAPAWLLGIAMVISIIAAVLRFARLGLWLGARRMRNSPRYKALLRDIDSIRREYGIDPLPDGTYDIDELEAYYAQLRNAHTQGWPIEDGGTVYTLQPPWMRRRDD